MTVSDSSGSGGDGKRRGKYITAATLIAFVVVVFLLTIAKRW